MKITSLDIQQKRFTTRFRGFDISEVDEFLEKIADEFGVLRGEQDILEKEISILEKENKGYKSREENFKRVMLNSQKVIEEMKNNARKSAEMINAEAEVKAEKILINAHTKLAELQDEIMELKRQRIKLNMGIRAILETHSKLLDLDEESVIKSCEEDSKVKYLKI
ncbi:MAG: DivIVA domain-containing protein [Desulfobacterales bacterium]|jgi:cell division initiation protein|nr:DivIVA domain-containing protein [Desulfobacteraceae bacterium]MBT7085303.1 DivIVA domain-containing protein [Desulfobacterales bacterium]MBT7696422.1 DivIVA domain-containing protein [Desulfobacterales bacterium]